jgi:hypothetical protein
MHLKGQIHKNCKSSPFPKYLQYFMLHITTLTCEYIDCTGPVACISDKDEVSRNQNNCYWPLHNESEFLQNLVKDKKIHEARAFNFTYRYIDEVLFIINQTFGFVNGLVFELIANACGKLVAQLIGIPTKLL